MQSSTLRRRSLVTAACTAALALAYGDDHPPDRDDHGRDLDSPHRARRRAGLGHRPRPAATCSPACPSPSSGTTASSIGRVRFAARGEGYEVALGPTGARLALVERGAAPREIGVRFLGGQAARAMTAPRRFPGRTHYYRGNNPRAWTANVPTFGRVRATGIYPGIDLEYYGRDRQLEYDFLVAPGADPGQIVHDVRRRRPGASVDATGDLLLQVGDARPSASTARWPIRSPATGRRAVARRLPAARPRAGDHRARRLRSRAAARSSTRSSPTRRTSAATTTTRCAPSRSTRTATST